MEDPIDTIIVCGGNGSRMEEVVSNYGCKSLVPILGIPVISYLTHSIREAVPNSRIILATDKSALSKKFKEIYKKQDIRNYQIYEGLPRGPVQAFYEAGSFCRSDRVLIFFGNQLVSPSHIKRLLSHNKNELILSGFDLLSENNCKIATIDKDFKVKDVTRYDYLESLKNNEIYLDVPYLTSNNFFSMETFPEIKRLFVKTPMAKTHLNYKEKVVVEKSDFPPEFHFKGELNNLERIVKKYFSGFLNKFGERFHE